MKKRASKKNKKNKPLFIITLLSFLIIILLSIYIIYLRFIPYATLEYDGYAVSGKEIANNLLNTNFDVDHSIKALEVKDRDAIYENLNTYYLGASKQDNININYPIYVNNSLALYNLSSKVKLITDDFEEIQGYSGTTLTSGELYNANTLERADYNNYILLKNADNLYINTKEFKIKTNMNEYTIKMNSIINFTKDFITYYTLNNGEFQYNKILDIDENSTITVEDYDQKYTYKEFLMNLGIIKEEKNNQTDEKQEEPKKEENKTNEKNTTIEETKQPTEEKQEEPENTTNETPQIPNQDNNQENIDIEKIWIKPTVTCTDFVSNVYSAVANLSISDPCNVIYKAITFTFYRGDEIAFRISSTSEGEVKATKLLPNTKYKIVGKYQYKNREGSIIENTILEQEITTKGVDQLNPIEMGFENGQIYSNKIQLNNFRVASNISDEAINGVSKADISINGVKYAIDTSTLRKLLKGESITYESKDGLKSNSTCDYEIIFYDTAGNIMALKNNKGSTVTSKQAPSVKIKVQTQEVISVKTEATITNEDNVEINNYRYVLYSETGEMVSSGNMEKSLEFKDLDPQKVYTIKIYADFDISDGRGMQYNQEIGTSTFSTLPLSKLGSLKLDVSYDDNNDITYNSINLTTKINTAKTDNRLIKILKNVKLTITDENENEVSYVDMSNIAELAEDSGIQNLIQNLKSNTKYNIVVTATAMQGNVEEEILTSYTLRNFITNKSPAKVNISNTIVTTSLIDFDIYIDDIDGCCAENKVRIKLSDGFGKEYMPNIEPSEIESNTKIPTNQWVRLTYSGLNENETYTLVADVEAYNETNDTSKTQNNYQINTTQFVTTGLGGEIDLLGLNRKQEEASKNLIDVKSNNNWYSQCFDAIKKSYELDENSSVQFKTESKYNYGKTYNENDNTLELLSNQCYVYDFTKYAGQTVTISFSAKITEENAKIYIQQGKKIGENIEQITGIKKGEFIEYQKTLNIPEDGYLGFYLEKYVETIPPANEDEEETTKEKDYNLIIKNLQVELGTEKTEYSKYGYKLLANTEVNFIDENQVTYNKDEGKCKYYVRLTSDKGLFKEFDYDYNSTEMIKEEYAYQIDETSESVDYTLELIIKQYGREYVLSSVEFNYNPETSIEIKSISSVDEFKEIQPYGNYIVLKDIELTNASSQNEFTYGNPNIPFFGSIDFNGKTISKETYSLNYGKETTSYIFYKLDENADLKNIVLDYYINNPKNRYTTSVEGIDTFIAKEDGIYSLFLYNNGSIDNIVLNLKESTRKQRINVGLIGYRNGGKIENFIINYETTLYGSQYMSGVCLYSTGTVQNGYIYGNGIEAIDDITIGDYRYIAGVVFQVEDKGIVQNIYNISTIKMYHCDSTYSYAANIVYNVGYPPVVDEMTGSIITSKDSTAEVRNVYSVQSLITIYNGYEYYGEMDASNKEANIGPNIINKYTSTKVNESYYFCDVTYEANDANMKSSATALYESGVQNLILNANGYNQFIVDMLVTNGYYPQLKLNYCMPKQNNIRIDVTGTEIIDILSGEKIENNDITNLELSDRVRSEIESYIKSNNVNINDENIALVSFRVYNPAGTTISEINVKYMDSEIITQSYEKKVSTVYVILKNPTSFLDIYDIDSVKSRMANGKIKESVYGENEDLGTRKIAVRFIKKIENAEDWNNINNDDKNGVSGLIQNYTLANDIDFANADYSPYITGDFQGYIDGKYNGKIHTLKNIEGTSSVISNFSKGTIKNIYVDNLVINSNSKEKGFIGKANINEDIEISNIHIKNMEVTSTYQGDSPCIGGIVGYLNSGSTSLAENVKIQNCSIQGFTIDFENTNVTDIRVGGIVGYLYIYGGVEAHISNSFVQNLLVNANVTSNMGIGGIVGYKGHDADERVKKGTPYVYIEKCYTTGKINTLNYAGGILGYGRYANTYIKYCYSMVNITSKITSGNAYIGGIAGYSDTEVSNITNNFYLGNIYVAGNNVNCVNRIFGGNVGTVSYKNYAYQDQLINGEIITNTLGATKLLTYAEAFQMNTYTNLLEYNDKYAYIITKDGEEFNLLENEYLPQLKDTDGNVLANQKPTAIDNDLKLDSITSTPSSDKTEVTVVMKFENRNNLNLTRVKIENNDMQVKEGTWKTEKDAKGLTVVTFVATPNRAYDSYKIESIFYERNGQETEKEITTKIKVELFKGISNATEWNEFFSGEGRTSEGQNVKITGNIDFSTVDKIENNVVVGKLEADEVKTISNINITNLKDNSGFIKEVKTSFANLNFENCVIKGSGNSIGLVSLLRGGMKNCNFTNINIENTGDNTGVVGRSIVGSFNNINLIKVQNKGRNYLGSLCGKATSNGGSSNLKGTYINITGTGNYIGGIFGEVDGTINTISTYQYSENGKLNGDTGTEYLVKGNSEIGGNIGRYASSWVINLTVTNSTIKGNSNVGGNVGEGSGNIKNAKSENNIINAQGDNIGGNVGTHGWTSTRTYI